MSILKLYRFFAELVLISLTFTIFGCGESKEKDTAKTPRSTPSLDQPLPTPEQKPVPETGEPAPPTTSTQKEWNPLVFTEDQFLVKDSDFQLKIDMNRGDFSEFTGIYICSEKLFHMKVVRWDVRVFAVNDKKSTFSPPMPGWLFDKPVIQKSEFVTQIEFKNDEITKAVDRARTIAFKNHKMFMINIMLHGKKIKVDETINIFLPLTFK